MEWWREYDTLSHSPTFPYPEGVIKSCFGERWALTILSDNVQSLHAKDLKDKLLMCCRPI